MKKVLTLYIVSCTLCLTGCWSRVEINERAFVSTMFVDMTDDGKLELTLAFPLTNRMVPSQAGGPSSTGNPFATLTYTGDNISEAYHKMQVDIPRIINWGHARVLVIGDKMAKKGISKILEFVIREPSLNINLAMFITPGKARDIIEMVPAFERSQSNILRGFTSHKITLFTTPKDFLETENGDMIVPLLKVGKKRLTSEKGKKTVWVGTDGMALFHDYKMVGKLSSYEGRGALWLRNTIYNVLITIKSPTDKKDISLAVLQAKAKIRPSKKDPFAFNVYIKIEDDIAESHSGIDLKNQKNTTKLEKIAEDEIKNRIRLAFLSTQKVKADVFQLSEYLSWYKPKIWKNNHKNWPSIYQDKVKLNIHVDLHIKRTGSENNPIKMKELSP